MKGEEARNIRQAGVIRLAHEAGTASDVTLPRLAGIFTGVVNFGVPNPAGKLHKP
jgi:hypothetical protein